MISISTVNKTIIITRSHIYLPCFHLKVACILHCSIHNVFFPCILSVWLCLISYLADLASLEFSAVEKSYSIPRNSIHTYKGGGILLLLSGVLCNDRMRLVNDTFHLTIFMHRAKFKRIITITGIADRL